MPHNLKLLPEEKVQLIQRCLKGEISEREASKITGMGSTTINQWIAQYKANGAEAFLLHRRNRVYSPELKREAVQDYLSGGGSVLDISMKYKLRNTRQLSNWLNMYNAHGNPGAHRSRPAPCDAGRRSFSPKSPYSAPAQSDSFCLRYKIPRFHT